jgi:hypothetical protein
MPERARLAALIRLLLAAVPLYGGVIVVAGTPLSEY